MSHMSVNATAVSGIVACTQCYVDGIVAFLLHLEAILLASQVVTEVTCMAANSAAKKKCGLLGTLGTRPSSEIQQRVWACPLS